MVLAAGKSIFNVSCAYHHGGTCCEREEVIFRHCVARALQKLRQLASHERVGVHRRPEIVVKPIGEHWGAEASVRGGERVRGAG